MKNQKVDTQYPNIEANAEEKQHLAQHPPVQKTFPKVQVKKSMKRSLRQAMGGRSDSSGRGDSGRG